MPTIVHGSSGQASSGGGSEWVQLNNYSDISSLEYTEYVLSCEKIYLYDINNLYALTLYGQYRLIINSSNFDIVGTYYNETRSTGINIGYLPINSDIYECQTFENVYVQKIA